MNILAVDCRVGEPDITPFAVACWTDAGGQYFEDWDAWREYSAELAGLDYTMVAHGAEQAVTLLLYQHNEHVRCYYREQRYTFAEWYYDCDHEPMPVWDVSPLCGNLGLRDLGLAVGLAPLETPQRYTWQYRAWWARPCIDHYQTNCPQCWGVIERVNWRCTEHDLPECDQCWKLSHAQAVYTYMARYAGMAEGYGIEPSRTIGGMTHRLWRHLDQPEPIQLPTRAMDDFARRGYRAGRTECFKLGTTGPVTYGDVSQMYATVLRDIELPTPESTRMITGAECSQAVLNAEGVTECTVHAPDLYLPVLGLIHADHFVFPIGTFRGVWSHTELRLALQRGYEITEYHQTLCGDALYRPFAGYVAGLMDWREQLRREKDPLELVVKLMLNALYGMIGMKAWHETEYVMPMPPDTTMADWPYHDIKVLHNHILLRRQDRTYRRAKYANPLWAALITAEARVRLYRQMEMCGNDLVYCDTDSLITMGELPTTGTQPGELRHQGFYDESYILAPKLYRLTSAAGSERVAHAGIPAWQMDRLIAQGEASRKTPVGILEGYHTGLEAGRWITLPVKRHYDIGKRQPVQAQAILDMGGWTDTRPLVMTEDFTGNLPPP